MCNGESTPTVHALKLFNKKLIAVVHTSQSHPSLLTSPPTSPFSKKIPLLFFPTFI